MAIKWLSAAVGSAQTAHGHYPTNPAPADSPGAAAALTSFDTAAAAIVAITGDTYSATTHQFTSGGATGLTHAQVATMEGQLNTALALLKTAGTAETPAASILIGYDTALSTNQLKSGLRALIASLGN